MPGYKVEKLSPHSICSPFCLYWQSQEIGNQTRLPSYLRRNLVNSDLKNPFCQKTIQRTPTTLSSPFCHEVSGDCPVTFCVSIFRNFEKILRRDEIKIFTLVASGFITAQTEKIYTIAKSKFLIGCLALEQVTSIEFFTCWPIDTSLRRPWLATLLAHKGNYYARLS